MSGKQANKQSAKLPNIVLEEALQKDGNEVQKESKANHCDYFPCGNFVGFEVLMTSNAQTHQASLHFQCPRRVLDLSAVWLQRCYLG